MNYCERCGAEFDPTNRYAHACEACGWEIGAGESCLMCGSSLERDDEWWEDGLCVACAELVGRP